MQLSDLKYEFTLIVINFIRFFRIRFINNEDILSRITPYAGSSPYFGKNEIINFIGKALPDPNIKILDVGPGRGIFNKLLKEKGYYLIDAVEVYRPYIEKFNLSKIYSKVFNENIINFKYNFYDLIIFGDVLEHLNIKDAKRVINFAQNHCKVIIVSVPYCDYQIGQQLDGSGDHKQYDLTRDVFLKRFDNFNVLIDNQNVGVFYSLFEPKSVQQII
jgi:hypothetical protein